MTAFRIPWLRRAAAVRVAIVFVCLLVAEAEGATVQQGTVAVTFPGLYRMNISTSMVAMPQTTTDSFTQGYVESPNAVTISVDSNGPWSLSICSTDSNLGTLGGNVKPLQQLRWKQTGTSHYQAISQQNVAILSSASPALHTAVSLDFRVLLDWVKDAPGDYAATLVVTLGGSS